MSFCVSLRLTQSQSKAAFILWKILFIFPHKLCANSNKLWSRKMAIHFVDRKSRLDRTSNFSSSLPNANEKIPLKKFVVGEHDSRNTLALHSLRQSEKLNKYECISGSARLDAARIYFICSICLILVIPFCLTDINRINKYFIFIWYCFFFIRCRFAISACVFLIRLGFVRCVHLEHRAIHNNDFFSSSSKATKNMNKRMLHLKRTKINLYRLTIELTQRMGRE